MVNLLETLYVVTAIAALVSLIAAVQTRGAPPERKERFRQRMRRAAMLALLCALVSAGLYWYLSVD